METHKIKKNIIFIARDSGGCGYFRCEQPSKFLERSGLAHSKYFLVDCPKEELLNADLVIMQNSGQ